MKTMLAALMFVALPAFAQAPTQDEAAALFAAMDSDRDGQLSLGEFEKGATRPFGSHGKGVVYQRLPARFRTFDADESGFLEAGEYAEFTHGWRGDGEAPALAQVDGNGDGKVDFREFAAIHVARDDQAGTDVGATVEDARAAPQGNSGRMHSPRARRNATLRRTG